MPAKVPRSRRPGSDLSARLRPASETVPTAGAGAVMRLQRSVGNRAVAQLLARDSGPEGESEPASETAGEGTAAPAWFLLNSDQVGPLPGDRVPGLSQSGPYSDHDRALIVKELDKRFAVNKKRWPKFLENFTGAIVELWTEYVTESMQEAAEADDWPWYFSLVSFAARETLMWMFFESWALEWAGAWVISASEGSAEEVVKDAAIATGEKWAEEVEKESEKEMIEKAGELLGKPTAYAMEQGSEWIHEHRNAGKMPAKAEELQDKTKAVAQILTSAVGPIGTLLADEVWYDRWLRLAPLSELGRFRLPPEVPSTSEQKIRTHVALELMAALNEWAETDPKGNSQYPEIVAAAQAKGLDDVVIEHWGMHGPAALRRAVTGELTQRDLLMLAIIVRLEVPVTYTTPSIHVPTRDRVDQTIYGGPVAGDDGLNGSYMMRPVSPVLDEVLNRAGIDLESYMVLELAYNAITIPGWSPEDSGDWTPGDLRRNEASRKSAIAKISRSTGGSVIVQEGGLLSHICLYEIAHPYEDVGTLVAAAAKDIARLGHQDEEQSTADVARALYDRLLPGMIDGGEFLIRNQLNPIPGAKSTPKPTPAGR